MPVVGEYFYLLKTEGYGMDSVSVNYPPGKRRIETYLYAIGWDDPSNQYSWSPIEAYVGVTHIRRRLPDDSDEEIEYNPPAPFAGSSRLTYFRVEARSNGFHFGYAKFMVKVHFWS